MRNLRVGGIYVVQAKKDDTIEYWAAAMIKQKAVAAVEKRLGPGWTVTLTDRRLTGQRLSKLRMRPSAEVVKATKSFCLPSLPYVPPVAATVWRSANRLRAPRGLVSERQEPWPHQRGVGIRRQSCRLCNTFMKKVPAADRTRWD
jgi:hypothetical protein